MIYFYKYLLFYYTTHPSGDLNHDHFKHLIKKLPLFLLFLLIIGSASASVPVTNFTSNISNGVVPLTVQFTASKEKARLL